MTKRLSVSLKDEEYAAVLKATAYMVRETGCAISPTEYIRGAIYATVCHDLKIADISETMMEEE